TNTAPGVCAQVVKGIDATFSDNCSVSSVAYLISGATVGNGTGTAGGQTFNKGVSTVCYTATDEVGNTAKCTFTVTVLDQQMPTIMPPADLADVPTDPGQCSTAKGNVVLGTPSTADNCGVATVVSNAPAYFPKGTTTVTWTVTDTSGNSATA